MTAIPPQRSLRKRLLQQHIMVIAGLLFFVVIIVAIMLERTLTGDLNKYMLLHGENCIDKLEQRLLSLFENVNNFSRSPVFSGFIVNNKTRSESLPKLLDSFVTKDVLSVTMLRLDKSVMYSTLKNSPDYSNVIHLKMAMVVGEPRFYLSDDNNLVYIVPMYLYKNIQAAMIIEYNLTGIFDKVRLKDSFAYRLYADNVKVSEKGFEGRNSYVLSRKYATGDYFILDKLKISVEIGALRSQYREVIFDAITRLLFVGIGFIIFAVFIAIRMGNSICRPILTLCARVEKSSEGAVKCSPLGTNDELELLAGIFDNRTEQMQQEIVQRKNAETSLKSAYDNLELRVQKRTAELATAKEAAEVSARVKAAFLANMSHEIRTPMNSILGFLEMVTDGHNLSEIDRKRYLNIATNSAHTLLGLINDILDVSKMESGKMTLELKPFNLRDLLQGVYHMFDIKLREKGLVFAYDIDPAIGDANFTGDPLRLRQILINLSGNAVNFTERGGIRIEVHPHTEEDLIRFDIIDTGIGIPARRLESIFDAFTQADSSTTRRFGGTGLGTTISRQLVEMMGGQIWVESEVGKGSAFHFTVNMKRTDETVQRLFQGTDVSEAGMQLTRPHRAFRILVAEDVEANILLLKTRLEHQGHTVVVAGNGIEAIALFKSEHFDLILMDIQMPQMDGVEATRHIRALETRSYVQSYAVSSAASDTSSTGHIPIIALTASVMNDEVEGYIQNGFNAVIGKPVNFNRLFDTIEGITQERVGRMFVEQMSVEPSDGDEAHLPTKLPSLEGIDMGKGINIWMEPTVYIDALIEFSRKYGNAARRISSLVEDNDMEPARRIVHSLKGLSGNLAMPQVYALSGDVEHALKERDIDRTRTLLQQLTTALSTVVDSICKLDVSQQVAPAPVTKKSP
ncbi:MAG: response regulator [Nitrospirae bacterium]|nr:response regulator [Nitrospirota bacterium]